MIGLRSDALVVDAQVPQLTKKIYAKAIEAVQIPPKERSPVAAEFQTRYAELQREEKQLLISWAGDALVVLTTRQQQEKIRSFIFWTRIVKFVTACPGKASRLRAKVVRTMRLLSGRDLNMLRTQVKASNYASQSAWPPRSESFMSACWKSISARFGF